MNANSSLFLEKPGSGKLRLTKKGIIILDIITEWTVDIVALPQLMQQPRLG